MPPPPPLPPQEPTPQPKKRGCLRIFLILLGIFVVLIVIGVIVSPKPPTTTSSSPPSAVADSSPSPEQDGSSESVTTPTAKPEGSPISWHEVDAIYNIKSNNTELQKDEEWKRFEGRQIVWSGRVSAVSKGFLGGLQLQVKMNPDTFTSDLIIELKDDQKAKAVALHTGDRVRFSGTLKNWGSLVPITLDDGEILADRGAR